MLYFGSSHLFNIIQSFVNCNAQVYQPGFIQLLNTPPWI